MNKNIKYIIEKEYLGFNPKVLDDDNTNKAKLPRDMVHDALFHCPENPELLRLSINFLFSKGIYDLNCIDVSQLIDFSYVFKEMKGLQELDISEWDVSNGQEFTSMFEGCTDFNSDISKWDMRNARKCYGMFNGCHRFNCDISGWKLPRLLDAANMFANCTDFSQDLSAWRLPNIADVHLMFMNCDNFNSDCIKEWNLSQRTSGIDVIHIKI